MRKRLHVNTLITEPGTIETEWDNVLDYTSGNFTLPSIFKYTPQGTNILWGRTEYGVAFDSVDSIVGNGNRVSQFSDHLTLGATSVLHDGEKLDIAIQPQASFSLRNGSGARLGATAIARYDTGRNSIGLTAGWSGAAFQDSSSMNGSNPAGIWDFGAGFGRRLAASGAWGHITPHANVVYERSTGFEPTVAAFGGFEYQVTERVAVDFSLQRFGLSGGTPDRQAVIGVTMNFGKLQ